jgi:flagellin-like hook-associated protein FlgL
VDDFYRYGNDFIVTVDEEHLAEGSPLLFFDAAYRIARTLVVSRVREEEEQAVDADYIRSEIENIIGALRYASDIFTKVGTIRNSADAIEKNTEKLQSKIEEHLSNIKAHLPA